MPSKQIIIAPFLFLFTIALLYLSRSKKNENKIFITVFTTIGLGLCGGAILSFTYNYAVLKQISFGIISSPIGQTRFFLLFVVSSFLALHATVGVKVLYDFLLI